MGALEKKGLRGVKVTYCLAEEGTEIQMMKNI